MKNICASCHGVDVQNIIKTSNEKKPRWLQKTHYVNNFINNTPIRLYKQTKTNMSLTLNVGIKNKNKFMLYWGAEPQKGFLIKDAKKAYNNFRNYGVAKVNAKGEVVIFFNCPQPYSTIEKGKTKRETFYRHIHFSFSNSESTRWLSSIYTKVIICNLTLKQTSQIVSAGDAVLINALPHEYYGKSHIPGSYNLYYKQIKSMSQSELIKWFSDVIEFNYSKLNRNIKQKKINIYEIPIIVYCAHDKCNAGELAAIELLKKGFVNIMDFKGGMKEYLS